MRIYRAYCSVRAEKSFADISAVEASTTKRPMTPYKQAGIVRLVYQHISGMCAQDTDVLVQHGVGGRYSQQGHPCMSETGYGYKQVAGRVGRRDLTSS